MRFIRIRSALLTAGASAAGAGAERRGTAAQPVGGPGAGARISISAAQIASTRRDQLPDKQVGAQGADDMEALRLGGVGRLAGD